MFQYSVRLLNAEDPDKQRGKHCTWQDDEEDPAEVVGSHDI
jgi:hypothetical protein